MRGSTSQKLQDVYYCQLKGMKATIGILCQPDVKQRNKLCYYLISQLKGWNDGLNAAYLLLTEQDKSVLVFNLGTCIKASIG